MTRVRIAQAARRAQKDQVEHVSVARGPEVPRPIVAQSENRAEIAVARQPNGFKQLGGPSPTGPRRRQNSLRLHEFQVALNLSRWSSRPSGDQRSAWASISGRVI